MYSLSMPHFPDSFYLHTVSFMLSKAWEWVIHAFNTICSFLQLGGLTFFWCCAYCYHLDYSILSDIIALMGPRFDRPGMSYLPSLPGPLTQLLLTQKGRWDLPSGVLEGWVFFCSTFPSRRLLAWHPQLVPHTQSDCGQWHRSWDTRWFCGLVQFGLKNESTK